MTSDFHSLEITGGEPLLHAQYIKDFLEKHPYKSMLETNATVPEAIELLADVIDIISMDIKLPEHFDSVDQWQKVYDQEIKSLAIMQEKNLNYYIKLVVSNQTSLEDIQKIMDDLKNITSADVDIIVQPVSPMDKWDDKSHLFEISELIANYYPVSIIPQIHKYMNIE